MKGDALLERLHNRVRVTGEPHYSYPPKPGCEVEAAANWMWTGVCVSCNVRAISAGQCKVCGYEHGGMK